MKVWAPPTQAELEQFCAVYQAQYPYIYDEEWE